MEFNEIQPIYESHCGSMPGALTSDYGMNKICNLFYGYTPRQLDKFFTELGRRNVSRPILSKLTREWRKWRDENLRPPKVKPSANLAEERERIKRSMKNNPYPGDCEKHGQKLFFGAEGVWFCWKCRAGLPVADESPEEEPATADEEFGEFDPDVDDGIPF